MAAQTASTVRAAALRSRCLSLAKTCSIGVGQVSILAVRTAWLRRSG